MATSKGTSRVQRSRKTTNLNKVPPEQATPAASIKKYAQECYLDMFTLRMVPMPIDYLEKFALEWVDFTQKDETVLTAVEFFIAKGVSRKTVDHWLDRSEILREAKQHVLAILGARREKGALNKQYEPSMVRMMQPYYDASYREIEEWRAGLKEKINSGLVGITVVEVPKFEDVPEVKPSKSAVDES